MKLQDATDDTTTIASIAKQHMYSNIWLAEIPHVPALWWIATYDGALANLLSVTYHDYRRKITSKHNVNVTK